jgi:peptidoglycan/xylan/chitin deacetylase (PgdA/CDA1 family)
VKDWAAAMLRVSGWLARAEQGQSKLGYVLMLHRVLPKEEHSSCYNPHLVLSPETLDSLLAFLKRSWRLVSVDEFLEASQASRAAGLVTLTFDDGWEDNYRCAAPVLRAHDVPACIYLATRLIGSDALLPEEHFFRLWRRAAKRSEEPRLRRIFGWPAMEFDAARARLNLLPIAEKSALLAKADEEFPPTKVRRQFMDWDQVRELSSQGFTFGSHTVDHAILTSETEASVAQQLRDSQEVIRRELGVVPRHFAYPRGAHDDRSVRSVESAGFASAVTTVARGVGRDFDRFRIPRIAIDDLVLRDAAQQFSATRTRLHFARATRATVAL